MKVLLTTEVPGLGVPGDVVEVRDGYARNYLLPKRLATRPTAHAVERYQKVREVYRAELADRRTRALTLAEKLDGAVLSFARKVHDEDRLYASVRPQDIVRQIEQQFGHRVDAHRITAAPIETLGEHQVEVPIYEDIAATVKVVVTRLE
ncbi:MAG: 50S ribosomal protein L9 [Candidatus Bipolaricaulaceae bacterium]